MKHTVCGTKINAEGHLITKSGVSSDKAVSLSYNNEEIFFCEAICKTEFLSSNNKTEWINNHK